jgi:hypothetical protein
MFRSVLFGAGLVALLCVPGASTAPAGSANPGSLSATVQGHQTHNGSNFHHVYFYGREEAVVSIKGNGNTDLDLYVYDTYSGCLVACSRNRTDKEKVCFRPGRARDYTIEVRNCGYTSNTYTLTHN